MPVEQLVQALKTFYVVADKVLRVSLFYYNRR